MKLYNKRIAFLISDQHFIPHGGIGSFCKSFTKKREWTEWVNVPVVDETKG